MVENDAIIGSMLYAIEMIARQAKVEIIAASDANEDGAGCGVFRQALFEDMSHSWGETLSEILSFLPWGWCPMETCCKVRQGPDSNDPTKRSKFTDNKIGWRSSLSGRRIHCFDGSLTKMVAFRRWSSYRHLISGCELFRLIRRFCSRTRNRKNNPHGRSLRNAYTSVLQDQHPAH